MGCENCTQKAIENNAKEIKTVEEAQALANSSGEWVGIYHEDGRARFAVGSDSVGRPIERYYTPKKDV